MMWWVLACASPEPRPCELLDVDRPPPTEIADVADAFELARSLQPLDGVHIELEPLESDISYFQANVDFATLSAAPRERRYLLEHNRRLFDDPPSFQAVVAILVHEAQHFVDFSSWSGTELAEWGAWYGTTDDISTYERQTDEGALRLGCGEGLSAFRVWLYDHVSPEVADQKRHDYYTPEEIDAWERENR
jgi:hypothetical protein